MMGCAAMKGLRCKRYVAPKNSSICIRTCSLGMPMGFTGAATALQLALAWALGNYTSGNYTLGSDKCL